MENSLWSVRLATKCHRDSDGGVALYDTTMILMTAKLTKIHCHATGTNFFPHFQFFQIFYIS